MTYKRIEISWIIFIKTIIGIKLDDKYSNIYLTTFKDSVILSIANKKLSNFNDISLFFDYNSKLYQLRTVSC